MAKVNSAVLARKKQEAHAALQRRDFSRAERLLRQVCKGNSKDAQAWFLLGAVHGEGGRFREVITCCRRVLALDPKNVAACTNLGNANASLGRHEEAAAAYEKALRLAPGDPGILFNYGNALQLAGRLEEAAARYRQALERRLGYPEAHFSLANIYVALGRNEEATPHYQQAVDLAPDLFEARLAFGKHLGNLGQLELAEVQYRAALNVRPDDVDALFGLAGILGFKGEYPEAIEICDNILGRRPEDPRALTAKADLLERAGQKEETYEIVRGLIDRQQILPACPGLYARLAPGYGDCDEAVALCRQFVAQSGVVTRARQDILFSLGKLLDRLGRYDEAFESFAEANALDRASCDIAKIGDEIDCLIAAFAVDVWPDLPRAKVESERPVFIVGMPRSGTSLAEQILASHPQVYGAGELNDIVDLVRSLPATLYPHSMVSADQEMIDGLARQYLERIDEIDRNVLRVIDKMPQNFFHLGLIALLFPNARVIHCKRDPRDTCISIYFQRFNLSHTYANDLASLGRFYREYLRIMAHWRAALPIPMLEVAYEEVVTDQERVSREMVEFCGLPWDDRCLQFHKTKRAVATASYDQVRQPIYKQSVGRWRNYERHLGPLFEALGSEG